MDTPDKQFYNKVATKFGGYKSGVIRAEKFFDGNPEKIFLEQLLNYAGNDKIVLDIGCADGRFTLKVSPNFKQIIAIDVSEQMLDAANKLQAEQKISNVSFQKADATKISFDDDYFDVIYSRRGPTPYQEIGRLLKSSGYFTEISIGEKDAQELKEIFGRGQGFGEWGKPILESKKAKLEAIGLKSVFAKEFFYSEYYSDIDDFSLWLESVPIFKDFDPTKDRKFLSEYVEKMKIQRGIELRRHRIVITAHKI